MNAMVHKTRPGQFWHLEKKPGTFLREQPANLLTACGRQLGRWHMVAPQPLESAPVWDLCESCQRKAAKDPEPSWLPDEESGELGRLQRSLSDKIADPENGIPCGTGERPHEGFFPDIAGRKPRPIDMQERAREQAALQCSSTLNGLCPIARECAVAAIANGETRGIWGGIPAWALQEAASEGPEALDELLAAAAAVLEDNDLDNDVDGDARAENDVHGHQLVA